MSRQVVTQHPTDVPGSHSWYVRGCRCVECRAANTEYSRAYYQRNLEKSRAGRRTSTAKYLRENPEVRRANESRRRAKKRGADGTHTVEEWLRLVEKFGGKCLYPGCDSTEVTRDHVLPLVMGGSDAIDNIQPLCLSHNSAKGGRFIDYRC